MFAFIVAAAAAAAHPAQQDPTGDTESFRKIEEARLGDAPFAVGYKVELALVGAVIRADGGQALCDKEFEDLQEWGKRAHLTEDEQELLNDLCRVYRRGNIAGVESAINAIKN